MVSEDAHGHGESSGTTFVVIAALHAATRAIAVLPLRFHPQLLPLMSRDQSEHIAVLARLLRVRISSSFSNRVTCRHSIPILAIFTSHVVKLVSHVLQTNPPLFHVL